MTLTQISKSEEVLKLRDYFVLSVETTGPDPASDIITAIALVQIRRNRIVRKAVVTVATDTQDGAPEEKLAGSMSRLLLGSSIVSEPEDLLFLKVLFETYGYDGELRFLPLTSFASAVFPGYAGQRPENMAEFLEVSVQEEDPLLRHALLEDEILQECKVRLGGSRRPVAKEAQDSRRSGNRFYIPTDTLKKWAKNIWSVSPWKFGLALVVIVVILILMFPRKSDSKPVDLDSAPSSYLVLTWNETGKYGTKIRGKDEIEFHIPYGVYNVLNNNSLPVEVSVLSNEIRLAELAAKRDALENEWEKEEVGDGTSMVIVRPSSTREIIVDENQFVTLSENANEMIFFYRGEVPEETASTTTGQATEQQVTVYGYIKGTEVRFRSAPSLEGQILDTLNNGQQVQILGVTGEWTAVMVQNQRGYVFSQFISNEALD